MGRTLFYAQVTLDAHSCHLIFSQIKNISAETTRVISDTIHVMIILPGAAARTTLEQLVKARAVGKMLVQGTLALLEISAAMGLGT